jgi:predicted ATPase
MITKIEISGFKSFLDFELEFSPLTVIAGTNASGKSNLFDALFLLSRLAIEDLRTAFSNKRLRGEVSELFTKYTDELSSSEMRFAVEMLVQRKIKDNWGRVAEVKTPRMRYELIIAKRLNDLGYEELSVTHESLSKIATDNDTWAKKYLKKRTDIWRSSKAGGSSKPYIYTENDNRFTTITIRQDGGHGRGRSVNANAVNQTILGSVTSVDFPHIFAAQREIASWNFMQLNPEKLREPTRYDINYTGDAIGHSGENLAAALYRLYNQDPYTVEKIVIKLSSFLSGYTELEVKDDKANKQFVFNLKNSEGKAFSSRVLSEGTLRLLVLCVLLYDERFQGLLCFEEPENGIHPYRIRAMVELLRLLSTDFEDEDDLLRQVIVNTHSPVLLGCLKELYNNTDNGVSIWFSKLISYPTSINGNKLCMRITRISPLTSSFQLTFSPEENKMTIADAMEYLKTESNNQQL